MTTQMAIPVRKTAVQLQIGGGLTEVVEIPSNRIDPSIAPSVMIGSRDDQARSLFYKQAAINLLRGDRWTSKRIFVTSPGSGDGKTFTAFSLAGALASSGKTVLLVEINFARPKFRTLLGNLKFRYGVDNAIRGKAMPKESVFRVEATGLHVAAVRDATPAGNLPQGLAHLHDFLDWGNERYELLIIDCPSVLSKEWDRWFHEFAGQSLLVVREGRTPLIHVRRAATRLDTRLTAALLNGSQQHGTELAQASRVERASAASMRDLEATTTISTTLHHSATSFNEQELIEAGPKGSHTTSSVIGKSGK